MDLRKEETSKYWKERAGIKDENGNINYSSNNSNAIKRKNKSNEKIKSMGIPTCESLPILEDSMANDFKSLDEIIRRAIASLLAVQLACDINAGEDFIESKNMFSNLLKEFNVENYLNPEEKKLFSGEYNDQSVLNITWEYECYWSLVWALGLIDDISIPNSTCDCDKAITLVSECKDYEGFKSKCKLRDVYEILDMLDLYYRYHWACVGKRINPNTNIADLNEEVVYERRRGLEWLFSEEDNWFDISLDT